MGEALTAAAIEAARDFTVEPVTVPEWGGKVFIRTLTADQRDEFVTRFIDQESGRIQPGVRSVTATLLAMTVCDEAGKLLFEDQERGRQVFAVKSAKATDEVFGKSSELNALRADDIEDLAGNLPETMNEDSRTGSA